MDPPLSGWNPTPFENRLGSFCARISEEDKIINNTHFLAVGTECQDRFNFYENAN